MTLARIQDEAIEALATDKRGALELWQRMNLALNIAEDFVQRAEPLQVRINQVIERCPEAEMVIGDLLPVLGMAVKQRLVSYVTGESSGFPGLNQGPSWL